MKEIKKIHYSDIKFPCIITDIDDIQERKESLYKAFCHKNDLGFLRNSRIIQEVRLTKDAQGASATKGFYEQEPSISGYNFYSYNDIDWNEKYVFEGTLSKSDFKRFKKNKTKKPHKKLMNDKNKLKKSYKFLDKDYYKKKEEERKEKYRIKNNLKVANKLSKELAKQLIVRIPQTEAHIKTFEELKKYFSHTLKGLL